MKKRCKKGTVDAVVTGGHYFMDNPVDKRIPSESRKRYVESIVLLSSLTESVLGFEPIVIAGPKMTDRSDGLLFINDQRRLYLVRPEVGNVTTENFLSSNIRYQEIKWQMK